MREESEREEEASGWSTRDEAGEALDTHPSVVQEAPVARHRHRHRQQRLPASLSCCKCLPEKFVYAHIFPCSSANSPCWGFGVRVIAWVVWCFVLAQPSTGRVLADAL